MVSHDSFVKAVCAEFTRTYGDGDKGVQCVSEGSLGQEREEIFKEAEAFRVRDRLWSSFLMAGDADPEVALLRWNRHGSGRMGRRPSFPWQSRSRASLGWVEW